MSLEEDIKTLQDLGPFPKVDPRDEIVRRDKREIQNLVWSLLESHELTYAEVFFILSDILSSLASTCLRSERRQNKDKS